MDRRQSRRPGQFRNAFTHGTPGTRVAKEATTAIPIVMAISGDAIATGLVSSLARPEANLTGSTFFLPQLNAKRLELLKEACPLISRPAALSNPDNPVSRPINSSDAGSRHVLEFDGRSRPGRQSRRIQACFRCYDQEPRRLGRGYRGRGICC
jgi:hypothetical protein